MADLFNTKARAQIEMNGGAQAICCMIGLPNLDTGAAFYSQLSPMGYAYNLIHQWSFAYELFFALSALPLEAGYFSTLSPPPHVDLHLEAGLFVPTGALSEAKTQGESLGLQCLPTLNRQIHPSVCLPESSS